MNGHSEVAFKPTDDICVIHLHSNGLGVEHVGLKVNQVDVNIANYAINTEYEYLSEKAENRTKPGKNLVILFFQNFSLLVSESGLQNSVRV